MTAAAVPKPQKAYQPKTARRRGPPEVRFWRMVAYPNGRNGCWVWTGSGQGGNGYGGFRVSQEKVAYAHRFSYEMARGSVPLGLELDHLCRVRRCVNPDHLEPVTRLENIRRSPLVGLIQRTRTQCPKGHLYSDENTYFNPRKGRGVNRVCRACSRMASAAWKKKGKVSQ